MIARIIFLSEIVLEGKSLKEIKEQFDDMDLFSWEAVDHYAERMEIIKVFNMLTEKDITAKMDKLYEQEEKERERKMKDEGQDT